MGEQFMNVDPNIIRFTHSKIKPQFSGCGKRTAETIDDILNHRFSLEDLPMITVIRGKDDMLFSLNNRRLYTLKHLRKVGFLQNRDPPNTITVRVKAALPRELEKYTVDNCSLNCTIMKERKEKKVDEESETFIDVDDEKTTEDCEESSKGCNNDVNKPDTFESIMKRSSKQCQQTLNKAVALSEEGKFNVAHKLISKLFDQGLLLENDKSIILTYLRTI